jgi:hypothetical protein
VPGSRARAEALKLAAPPLVGADIEPAFSSQARVSFDYLMGKLKVETLSDRLFVKINAACWHGVPQRAGCPGPAD